MLLLSFYVGRQTGGNNRTIALWEYNEQERSKRLMCRTIRSRSDVTDLKESDNRTITFCFEMRREMSQSSDNDKCDAIE